MAKRDVICAGASAGGVPALSELVSKFPTDFPAAILVALHVSADFPSVLPRILSSSSKLPAHHAENGEPLLAGRIYVAPPDRHLLVESGRLRVVRGARENGHRPAIDPLFRTAAVAYGSRVIGIVLTGALDDGAAGLLAIQQRGGLALVEDPETAYCPDMPRAALELVSADHVLPVAQIGELLPKLVTQEAPEVDPPPALLEREAAIALARPEAELGPPGDPSTLSCPACGGVMHEVQEGKALRFRCRVGHSFSAASMAGAQQMGVEAALWAALRALEEQAALERRLGARARHSRQARSATRFEERAEASEGLAEVIRRILGVIPPEREHG